jgi:hypothetical protein
METFHIDPVIWNDYIKEVNLNHFVEGELNWSDYIGELNLDYDFSGMGDNIVDIIRNAFSDGIPRLQAGIPYVPREMLAVLHPGEAVIPAYANRGGGARSFGDINVTIRTGNIYGESDYEAIERKLTDRLKGAIKGVESWQ